MEKLVFGLNSICLVPVKFLNLDCILLILSILIAIFL